MLSEEEIIKEILKIRHAGASVWDFRTNFLFDISPYNFLEFSKKDLKIKTKRGSINSLSNVKRCIDCQVDTLLSVLGQTKKSKKERWNFPQKIEFLNKIGILSPSILNKINKKRNLLEHEYKFPRKEEIEDAIDIAELFLNATEKFTTRKVDYFEIYLKDKIIKNQNPGMKISSHINFEFIEKEAIFNIEYIKRLLTIDSVKTKQFSINSEHPKFMDLLKKYVLLIQMN